MCARGAALELLRWPSVGYFAECTDQPPGVRALPRHLLCRGRAVRLSEFGVKGSARSLVAELADADFASAVLWSQGPSHVLAPVAHLDSTKRECPLGVREVPQRRHLVVSEKMEEDAFRLHVYGHLRQRRCAALWQVYSGRGTNRRKAREATSEAVLAGSRSRRQ